MTATVSRICRYPVKGMNAETLSSVVLAPGAGLPHDRRFAIAHATSGFDPAAPSWQPKGNFVTLMRSERLAQLDARFDPDTGALTILRAGKQVVRADITVPLGRTIVDQFLSAFLGDDARGKARLIEVPGRMLSDVPENRVSVIGLASVADLERVVRAPVDLLRFRANLYLDGTPAWAELSWPGREIVAGEARLRIVGTIQRCAATNVNPATAVRDLNLPLSLQRGFGHVSMGVYAEVVEGGIIRSGSGVAAPA